MRAVNKDPDYYLKQIQASLINKTYQTSDYDIFTIIDKGKEREIYKLPYYPDRIVHWAIMLRIEDIFVNTFIRDTYASIPKRGIHDGLKRLHAAMEDKQATKYCLKIDIKKFFPNINHTILKNLLRRKIKDPDLLWLLDEVIDSIEGDRGIPIGNYLSQYFANFYLAYFDHWAKEGLGIKYYFRYMDDIVILSNSKERLRSILNQMRVYLREELNLEIKSNWQIFPTRVRGVDFLGYRSFGDYTLLRKSTAKNLKRKMRKISKRNTVASGDISSIMSYKGWLKWCNAYNLECKYIKPLIGRLANDKSIQYLSPKDKREKDRARSGTR